MARTHEVWAKGLEHEGVKGLQHEGAKVLEHEGVKGLEHEGAKVTKSTKREEDRKSVV